MSYIFRFRFIIMLVLFSPIATVNAKYSDIEKQMIGFWASMGQSCMDSNSFVAFSKNKYVFYHVKNQKAVVANASLKRGLNNNIILETDKGESIVLKLTSDRSAKLVKYRLNGKSSEYEKAIKMIFTINKCDGIPKKLKDLTG